MKKFGLVLIAAAAALFFIGTGRTSVRAADAPSASSAGSPSGARSDMPPAAFGPVYTSARVPGVGEKEMKALALSYPGRIAETVFRDGEWALRIDETWYYWANGRVLPAAERGRWSEFVGLRFYAYPRGLPPLRDFDEETKKRIRERLEDAEENPPARSEAFLSHLHGAATREETEAQLVRVTLMGFPLRLHRTAAEKLELVERDIRALAKTDPEVRRFFSGLSQIGGYHWRPIAGTASRSYHSYGLALDIIPKNWGGKQYYWRNLMRFDEEWYSLPYEKRWMVPLTVVEAFERHGFIWGGKWLYFDTVHFEYRPELLVLADAR